MVRVLGVVVVFGTSRRQILGEGQVGTGCVVARTCFLSVNYGLSTSSCSTKKGGFYLKSMFRTSVGYEALYGRRTLGACDCVHDFAALRPVNAYRSAMMPTTTEVDKNRVRCPRVGHFRLKGRCPLGLGGCFHEAFWRLFFFLWNVSLCGGGHEALFLL